MPYITLQPLKRDYIEISTRRPGSNRYSSEHIESLAQEFWRMCLATEIDHAELVDNKLTIFVRAQARLKDILDLGERYCILLHAECVRNGLEAITYSPRVKRIRSFSKTCSDFKEAWLKDPKLRKAHVLAEYL